MTINTKIYSSLTTLKSKNFSNHTKIISTKQNFAEILERQKQQQALNEIFEHKGNTNSTSKLIDLFKEQGFKGFFQAIEKEKIKKLRKEILNDMGLTEQKLAKLSPKQRAEIEKRVSEEIQRRMNLESSENDESLKKIINSPLLKPHLFSASTSNKNKPAVSFIDLSMILNSKKEGC